MSTKNLIVDIVIRYEESNSQTRLVLASLNY